MRTMKILSNVRYGMILDEKLKLQTCVKTLMSPELANCLKKTLSALTNSKKRWVKGVITNPIRIENPLSDYVKSPKELLPILSQIRFIDNDNHAIDLQKKLSVGQILVNKAGNIWRWDGFISEDNLQKKKIIDSHLRITKLRESEKIMKKQLSDLRQFKEIKINEEKNIVKNLLAVNSLIEDLYKKRDHLTPKIPKLSEQISIINLNIQNFP